MTDPGGQQDTQQGATRYGVREKRPQDKQVGRAGIGTVAPGRGRMRDMGVPEKTFDLIERQQQQVNARTVQDVRAVGATING